MFDNAAYVFHLMRFVATINKQSAVLTCLWQLNQYKFMCNISELTYLTKQYISYWNRPLTYKLLQYKTKWKYKTWRQLTTKHGFSEDFFLPSKYFQMLQWCKDFKNLSEGHLVRKQSLKGNLLEEGSCMTFNKHILLQYKVMRHKSRRTMWLYRRLIQFSHQ